MSHRKIFEQLIIIYKRTINSFLLQYGPRYAWSKKDQSLILGGFFYGYLLTSLFGGILAERFGGRHVVGLSMLFSAFITGITPYFAADNVIPIFITRVILGILGVSLFFIFKLAFFLIITFINCAHATASEYM